MIFRCSRVCGSMKYFSRFWRNVRMSNNLVQVRNRNAAVSTKLTCYTSLEHCNLTWVSSPTITIPCKSSGKPSSKSLARLFEVLFCERYGTPVRFGLFADDGGKDGRLVQRENDIRAAATCFAIVILFCLAWSPYACVALISTFGRPDLISPYVNCLPALFAKASAVYNPFIYALMNDRFRKVVLTMVGCGEKRRWDPQERYRRSPSPAYPHSQGSKRARSSSTMSVSMSLLSTSATTPTGTQPLFKRSSFDESQEDNEAMNHTGDATEREKRGSLLMTSDLSVVHEKGESSAMAAEAEDVFPIHDWITTRIADYRSGYSRDAVLEAPTPNYRAARDNITLAWHIALCTILLFMEPGLWHLLVNISGIVALI